MDAKEKLRNYYESEYSFLKRYSLNCRKDTTYSMVVESTITRVYGATIFALEQLDAPYDEVSDMYDNIVAKLRALLD